MKNLCSFMLSFFVLIFILAQVHIISPVGQDTAPFDKIVEIENSIVETGAFLTPIFDSVVELVAVNDTYYDRDLFDSIVDYGILHGYPDLTIPERKTVYTSAFSFFISGGFSWHDNYANFYNTALKMKDEGLITLDDFATVQDYCDYLVCYAWIGPIANFVS